MKSPSLLTTAAILGMAMSPASAWTVPDFNKLARAQPSSDNKSPLDEMKTTVAAAVVGAAILASSPFAAHAFDPQTFNHQYSDPKHPNCKRIVVVKRDGSAALSGTDGTPGCPEDGSGNVWRLVGEVEDDTITVDFSAKGGPADLKGKWEPSGTPGIRWPDGNKWTVNQ